MTLSFTQVERVRRDHLHKAFVTIVLLYFEVYIYIYIYIPKEPEVIYQGQNYFNDPVGET